jgi:hypothetical protein
MAQTDTFYSSNPAEWTSLEAVYISRKKAESQVVGGDVNTPALVGQCVRGPSGPLVINSPSHFLQVYGGRDAGGGGAVTGQIWKALNARQWSWPLVCSRAIAAAGVAATVSLVTGTDVNATATASSKGVWANGSVATGVTLDIVAASDGNALHWDLLVYHGGVVVQRIQNINTQAGYDNTAAACGSDPSNLIVLTKGAADGRPTNATGIALGATIAGAEGTIAASDYVTALAAAANFAKSRIVTVCERAVDDSGQGTVNAEMIRLAALMPDKLFVTWGGTYAAPATDVTTFGTQIRTKTRTLVFCNNTSYTYDQNADALIEGGCHLDMAAVLSMTAPEIHPGDEDNYPILAGLRKLHNEALERVDLKTLKATGICALEKTDSGFRFHSGVTSDLSEITDVRTEQFLTTGIAEALKYDVRKPFTEARATTMVGKVITFLKELRAADRIVDKDSKTLGPAWDIRWVQTDSERARNIGKLRVAIRIMPHLLYLVLEIDISTGTITTVR